jgi:transmembrane sensor
MELTKMPNGLFTKKLLGTAEPADELKFREITGANPRQLEEFQLAQQIWKEAEKVKVFEEIDVQTDWKSVALRINPYSFNYKRIPWTTYFLRIAAIVILTSGISFGFYKLLLDNKNQHSEAVKTDFTIYKADDHKKELLLSDGSHVTLNASSDITFREGFGKVSRDVILNGEAFFNVRHNPEIPFRVYSGETVIEVTGTSFSVYQRNGKVNVSVISGTVLLSASESQHESISVKANQSARVSGNNEIQIEEGIPVNILSWKTGHLVFDETPIDSALFDIARHFRRDLTIQTALSEKITAEFQDQPLHEILDEINLVAGLEFDTTGTALIVRK